MALESSTQHLYELPVRVYTLINRATAPIESRSPYTKHSHIYSFRLAFAFVEKKLRDCRTAFHLSRPKRTRTDTNHRQTAHATHTNFINGSASRGVRSTHKKNTPAPTRVIHTPLNHRLPNPTNSIFSHKQMQSSATPPSDVAASTIRLDDWRWCDGIFSRHAAATTRGARGAPHTNREN